MKPPSLFLESLGLYLPESYPTTDAVSAGLYEEEERDAYGWTGVAIAGDISAPDMAVVAAREALSRSRYSAQDVALLLHGGTGVQGTQGWMPHHYVQRHALGGFAAAIELGQNCNGCVFGISLAAGYLSLLDGDSAALITGADNWGFPGFDRFGYARGLSDRGSIFGDAACAMVVSNTSGFARVKSICNGSVPEMEEMWRHEGPLFPPRLDPTEAADLAERAGSFVRRAPERLPGLMADFIKQRKYLISEALAEADVDADDVARFTHVFSGTSRYIEGIARPFGLSPGKGMLEFGRGVGHLSVCDHIASLAHLVTTRALQPGDHVLVVSNGAGMSLTVAVIEIVSVPEWRESPRHRRVTAQTATHDVRTPA
jgi:3-oxoacyl-[acyl-carrier-protein] synthase III